MIFTKREINKGTTRLGLVDAMLEELNEKPFNDINIIDICKKVNISKVTFFNYFDHKEQLVELYIHLWLYQISEIIDNNNTLEENLEIIFDSIYSNNSGMEIMKAYLQHVTKSGSSSSIILSNYEKYITSKSGFHSNNESFDIYELFHRILSEGKLINKISELLTFFMGLPLSSELLNLEPKEIYLPYIKSLRRLSWRK